MTFLMINGKFATQGGKFLLATPQSYDEFVRCCCPGTEDCCSILINFAHLVVTGDIAGNPIGAPGVGWHGETDPGASAEFSSVDDFHIYCEEATEFHGGRFRIELSISSSAPCAYTTTVFVDWPSPCCPLSIDIELTDVPELCQTGGVLTFNISTPGDIPCPT